MTKLRTSLGDGRAGGPFPQSVPAHEGTRSERRRERRRLRRQKAMAQARSHWPDAASSCEGKERRTEGNARMLAAILGKQESGQGMNAYLCGYCGHWHVGHSRRR